MNEDNFTKKKKGGTFFLILCQLVLLAVFFVAIKYELQKTASSNASSSWTTKNARQYANKLKSEGLTQQAKEAYEDYLSLANADREMRANIYFTLGKALMEDGLYEDALSYFYKVEITNPENGYQKELGINIVTCLEKLGRSLDASSFREDRVSLEQKQGSEEPRGEPVARIGNRIITLGEIHDHLDALPEYLKNRYLDKTEKAEFIQQYVVNRVLLQKALGLQYQNDPEIRKKIRLAQEGLIIQKLIREEISDSIQADRHDLKTYYEANLDKYRETADDQEGVKPFEDVFDQVRLDYMLEKSGIKLQDYLAKLFLSYDVEILYQIEEEEPSTETAEEESTS